MPQCDGSACVLASRACSRRSCGVGSRSSKRRLHAVHGSTVVPLGSRSCRRSAADASAGNRLCAMWLARPLASAYLAVLARQQHVDIQLLAGLAHVAVVARAQLAAEHRRVPGLRLVRVRARRPPRRLALSHPPTHQLPVVPGDDEPRSITSDNQWYSPSYTACKNKADAARNAPPFAPLHIVSDSKYVIDGLTLQLPKWEARGWINVANSELFRVTAYHLRRRSAPTTFRWVKGHSGDEGNEGADNLAGQGAGLDRADDVDLAVPLRFDLSGAQISTLSQALAYRGILTSRTVPARRKTAENVELVQQAVLDVSGTLPSPELVWTSLRSKHVSRPISDFLWKCMHNALRCGSYWEHIPGYEDRALCPSCGVVESAPHMLLECDVPGARLIWELAQQLFELKGLLWPPICMGTILGCNLISFERQGQVCPGARRLFSILVSESTYLIWKLRCERRIEFGDAVQRWHTVKEISRRWLFTINSRLALDRIMTSAWRYGSQAIPRDLVLRTWDGTLRDNDTLPDDWINTPGVLVGMEPPE
ncbi:hypothetical protein EIP86_009286 [Pleurotus ostreatoroseus]|nr:hypothetical protein EIP86_009286 [Pleurotus ostreatoroseus]